MIVGDPLGARITRAFPGIGSVEPLRELGCGVRSHVVQTAGGVAVKVGRIADAADEYAREWRLLPVLASNLRVPIPSPRWHVPPTPDFPHGALAYPMLRGLAPPSNGSHGLAADLGNLLAELHALPRSVADEARLVEWDPHARIIEARPAVTTALAQHLSASEFCQIEAWWEELAADPHFPAIDRAICHHDLWHDNLLVDERGRLSAVLDWDVDWSDPAHDFAPLRHFGEAFAQTVVAAYVAAGGRFDAEIAWRADRYWESRDLGGLAFAIEHEDEAEALDAIRKVRAVHFGR